MSDFDPRVEALAELSAVQYHFDEGLNGSARATAALAYATLDVADAIRGLREDIGVCPHGSTGICMNCMRDFAAVRS